MIDKTQLRTNIRQQRRLLSADQQELSATSIARLVSTSAWFQKSENIACYLASDGEIDPKELVNHIWESGKRCYLPVLDTAGINRLDFVSYSPDTQLVPNRFGIPEPVITPENTRSAEDLDMVCLPMVAFDSTGNRMGMGKGFYDRTLEFLNSDNPPAQPKLMGLAHSFQQVESLKAEVWDIPLGAVVTEAGITFFD